MVRSARLRKMIIGNGGEGGGLGIIGEKRGKENKGRLSCPVKQKKRYRDGHG